MLFTKLKYHHRSTCAVMNAWPCSEVYVPILSPPTEPKQLLFVRVFHVRVHALSYGPYGFGE